MDLRSKALVKVNDAGRTNFKPIYRVTSVQRKISIINVK